MDSARGSTPLQKRFVHSLHKMMHKSKWPMVLPMETLLPQYPSPLSPHHIAPLPHSLYDIILYVIVYLM